MDNPHMLFPFLRALCLEVHDACSKSQKRLNYDTNSCASELVLKGMQKQSITVWSQPCWGHLRVLDASLFLLESGNRASMISHSSTLFTKSLFMSHLAVHIDRFSILTCLLIQTPRGGPIPAYSKKESHGQYKNKSTIKVTQTYRTTQSQCA